MSIKQIGKEWLLDARIWVNGIEYRKREKFQGGKKTANELYQKIKNDLRKKAKSEQETSSLKIQKFGQALDYYFEVKENNLVSPSSFKRMENDLYDVPIHCLHERFRAYWINLQRTRSRQTGDFLAPSTVNHYTVMAKAALNLCVKDGLLDKNPLKSIPILKVAPRDITLSEIDKQRLLNVIDREAKHLSAIVRFAMAVPCRKMELVNLRKADLDLFNMAVRVRHENAKGDNGSWKPIPPNLYDYFRNLHPKTEYLFYRIVKRNPVRLGNFRRAFIRCLKLAGITDLHFHDFRHLSSTALLNAGNAEQVVCQIAGWKSGNMIKLYYHKDGLRAARQIVFPEQEIEKNRTKPDRKPDTVGVVNL